MQILLLLLSLIINFKVQSQFFFKLKHFLILKLSSSQKQDISCLQFREWDAERSRHCGRGFFSCLWCSSVHCSHSWDGLKHTAELGFITVYIELSAPAALREQLGCRIAGIARNWSSQRHFRGAEQQMNGLHSSCCLPAPARWRASENWSLLPWASLCGSFVRVCSVPWPPVRPSDFSRVNTSLCAGPKSN